MKGAKIGDVVSFKSDIEQWGTVIRISHSSLYPARTLTLENKDGFSGDYISGDTITTRDERDCWIE